MKEIDTIIKQHFEALPYGGDGFIFNEVIHEKIKQYYTGPRGNFSCLVGKALVKAGFTRGARRLRGANARGFFMKIRETPLSISDARRTGYYWVNRNNAWMICGYASFSKKWQALSGGVWSDSDFDIIDENPIVRS